MVNKNGSAKIGTTRTTLKFRGIRRDGQEDVVMETPVDHENNNGLHQARAQVLMTFTQLGGFVKDLEDGTTEVYPMHLFEKIVIEANSIVVARPLIHTH